MQEIGFGFSILRSGGGFIDTRPNCPNDHEDFSNPSGIHQSMISGQRNPKKVGLQYVYSGLGG